MKQVFQMIVLVFVGLISTGCAGMMDPDSPNYIHRSSYYLPIRNEVGTDVVLEPSLNGQPFLGRKDQETGQRNPIRIPAYQTVMVNPGWFASNQDNTFTVNVIRQKPGQKEQVIGTASTNRRFPEFRQNYDGSINREGFIAEIWVVSRDQVNSICTFDQPAQPR